MPSASSATGSIAHALKGVDFPCGRDGLVDYARRRGAGPDALATLERLPEQDYTSMADVFQAVGGEHRAGPGPQAWSDPGASPVPEALSLPPDPWSWWSQSVTAWVELNRCLLAQWFPWLR